MRTGLVAPLILPLLYESLPMPYTFASVELRRFAWHDSHSSSSRALTIDSCRSAAVCQRLEQQLLPRHQRRQFIARTVA